eukprot:153613-Pyramimonas_sp.AAC.1
MYRGARGWPSEGWLGLVSQSRRTPYSSRRGGVLSRLGCFGKESATKKERRKRYREPSGRLGVSGKSGGDGHPGFERLGWTGGK